MGLDASDLVDALLDDQARVNSAVDDGDVNNLVADFQTMSGELLGMTGAETVTTIQTAPPHDWDDPVPNNTIYGFFSWA